METVTFCLSEDAGDGRGSPDGRKEEEVPQLQGEAKSGASSRELKIKEEEQMGVVALDSEWWSKAWEEPSLFFWYL